MSKKLASWSHTLFLNCFETLGKTCFRQYNVITVTTLVLLNLVQRSAKLRAVHAFVPYVLSYLTCLVPYVLCCFTSLVTHVPPTLRAFLPQMTYAVHVFVPRVLRALRAIKPHVLCALRALVSHIPCVLRVLYLPRFHAFRAHHAWCLASCQSQYHLTIS